jgi:hypothetical protein
MGSDPRTGGFDGGAGKGMGHGVQVQKVQIATGRS